MVENRINKFKGTSREVGISIGKSIGDRFSDNIDKMIETVDKSYGINFKKLEKESMIWLKNLLSEYQEELEGISIGAGCSIEKIAKWYYSSMSIDGGCTSFITKIDNQLWVGRNNDYLLPKFWGYINIIEVNGKIPVMLFGLEGDIFSGTGFNKERVWIHYNWLPVWNVPLKSKEVIAPFVFIRKALETCKSINDVEALLKDTTRDGGMNLFVIDGKNNEFAVFECTCKSYRKRETENSYIVGANHYCEIEVPNNLILDFEDSVNRQSRVEELLLQKRDELSVKDMIDILADSKVEQNDILSGTVYSNVACPSENILWFAHDDFPAASKGNWRKIEWSW
jgi:hypothetical protein